MKDAPPFVDGVNVCGYLRGEIGLGSAARGYIAALEHLGVPLALTDVSHLVPGLPGRAAEIGRTAPDNLYGVNLICVPAQDHANIARHVGDAFFRDHYNIGVWVWELPEFPPEFHPLFAAYDEIWTGSSFVASAVSRASPLPVIPIVPPAATLAGDRERGRARIRAADETVFLFVFDFWGIAERKNALAVIDAFTRAFRPSDPARLVIKSANGWSDPAYLARMRERATDANITLFDGYWETSEIHDLMAACDVYVSLHRAEGTGLTMLEAMSLGKPVIATGWSGNMDFMVPGNSFLVELDVVPLTRDFGPYRAGQRWAEPSIEHAAMLMRRCVEDDTAAARVGKRAAQDVARFFSVTTVADVLLRRMEVIASNSRERGPERSAQRIDAQFRPAIDEAGSVSAAALSPGQDDASRRGAVSVDDVPHERVETDLGPMVIHVHDTVVSDQLRRFRTWDPAEGRLLRRIVKPGMTVVDVGANIGYFTVLLGQLVGPHGQVIAIEPEPRNVALLQANVDLHGLNSVAVLPLAAADAEGELRLSLNLENRGDHRAFGDDRGGGIVVIRAARLDDVLEPGASIDVVKIDVQGMDHVVVQGLANTIERWRPIVVVEFEPASIRAYGDDPKAVLALYRGLGYEIVPLAGAPAALPESDDTALIQRLSDRSDHHVNLLLSPPGEWKRFELGAYEIPPLNHVVVEGVLQLPESSWRPVLQRSIDAFYEGSIDEGAAACRALLNAVGLPQPIRELTYRNQTWYARPLPEMVPGAAWQPLTAPMPEEALALDPSPVFHEHRLTVVMRHIPGQEPFAGSTPGMTPAGPLHDFEIITVPEAVEDGRRRTELRPFFENGAPRIAAILRGAEAGDAARAAVLWLSADGAIQTWEFGPRYGDFRQGWSPVLTADGPRFIAWWEPTEVFRLDAATGEFTRVASRMAPHLAERFQGGSQGVSVPGGFIFLVNESVTLDTGDALSFSRFVRLDEAFQITDVSPQFFLEERGQEAACGLTRQGDRLIAGFSVGGSRALLASMDLASVVATLLPIAAPGPTHEPVA